MDGKRILDKETRSLTYFLYDPLTVQTRMKGYHSYVLTAQSQEAGRTLVSCSYHLEAGLEVLDKPKVIVTGMRDRRAKAKDRMVIPENIHKAIVHGCWCNTHHVGLTHIPNNTSLLQL